MSFMTKGTPLSCNARRWYCPLFTPDHPKDGLIEWDRKNENITRAMAAAAVQIPDPSGLSFWILSYKSEFRVRLKIYTKQVIRFNFTFGGKRVSKADLRIDTYGTVDELNSWIGVLRDQSVNQSRKLFCGNSGSSFLPLIHSCHWTWKHKSEDSFIGRKTLNCLKIK